MYVEDHPPEMYLAILEQHPSHHREKHRYDVKSRICTSADWMFKNGCLLELNPSDILAVMDPGVYYSSNASDFAFPRPAILVVEDGVARVIRREETFEHLIVMYIEGHRKLAIA